MKRIIILCLIAFPSIVGIYAQTSGTLTVTATTSATSTPEYAPNNIVAFWIENSSGSFVKTLLAYASERKQYLVNWKSKTTLAGSAYNVVDAVTGATKGSHASRTATWNGTNRSSVQVADGTYTVKMEVTDNDGVKQNLASISFTKGTTAQTLTPAATNGFSSITIKWTPVTTDLIEQTENAFYRIYPTVASETIYVTGTGIQTVEVCDLKGQLLLSSNQQSLKIAQLPSGTYLAHIITDNGNFVRKFVRS